MINIVALEGRLTKPPELRKTASNVSVMQFTLAVRRRFQKEGQPEADFISCVAWRQAADFIAQYAGQGDMISVEGKLQTRNYDGQSGKVYVTEVICESVNLVARKKETPAQNPIPRQEDYMLDADPGMFGADPKLDISSDDLPFY